MPPAGRPRPTEAAYDGLVAHLETSLDRVAAANPGSRPHRYVPPPESHRISERRFAIFSRSRSTSRHFCRATTRAMASTTSASAACRRCCSNDICRRRRKSAALPWERRYVLRAPRPIVLPPDLTQEDHFDGQSFGTRAGTSVRYTFPADGEYQFELRLTRDRNELIEGLTEPHQVEVSVDGTQLQMFTLTPRSASRTERQRRAAIRTGTGGRCAPELPDARDRRTPRRAGGVHQAAVRTRGDRAAAVSRQLQQRPHAENAARALQRVDCGTVQPERHRRYPEPETYVLVPALEGERRDRMRPDDSFCAGAPGVSASADESRSGHTARLLQAGPRGRQLRARHRDGAARDADEPGVPLPDRARAGVQGVQRVRWVQQVPIASTISSWPRGFRFSLEQHSRRSAARCGRAGAPRRIPPCSSSRCGACWPTTAPRRS